MQTRSTTGNRARTILNVDLNLLVVLHALLEEKSVTRAAGRICLSQPATSSALSRLRDVFNDPLLVRLGNRMELTRFALELKEPLREAIIAIDEILGEPLPFDPAKAHTTIRIGASDYNGIILLPELERRLQQLAPGFKLDICSLREPEILQRLEKEDVDILLGHFPDVLHLHSEVLFPEKFVCVMRDAHPLLERTRSGRIPLKDFIAYQHVAIAREGGKPDPIDVWLSELNVERRVGIHVPYYSVTPGIVAGTDMISVATQRIVKTLGPLFGLTTLDLPSEFGVDEMPVHMIWAPHTDHDPALSWIRSLILEIATEV